MEQLSSRKWQLTIYFSFITTIGLFTNALTGGEFMGIAITLIGGYNMANVMGKRYEQQD